MNRPDEDAIRDHLAARLEIIEPGLTLIAPEHYLRNTQGAAGFLDIFARARNGQLVIIEIKRTNAAAREALQELFKYAALVRQNYLIRDIDYRLMVLSVEWHELLTPYSELVRQAPYEISAGAIILGPDGLPARVDPVTPLPPVAQRKFSKRHFLWRFPDEQGARRAVPLISAHMQKAGLADFVLIRSRSTNPEIQQNGFIYFAQQELSLAEYQSRLRAQLTAEEYEEYETLLEDAPEEEDRIAESADRVWLPGYDDLFEAIGSDNSEISHPEKAAQWFREGAQTDIEIERFGRFVGDEISDAAIITELIGHGGSSDYTLDVAARTDSPPQMTALLKGVENVFFYNSEWRGAIRDLIAYASSTGPASITLKAFCNEDILRAIAGIAFEFPGFAPTFRFDIQRDQRPLERFFGLPEWDKTTPDFDTVLARHFGEDPFGYFVAYHFGEHRSLNADIMRDLGLRYSVFRQGPDGPERIRVQGSSIVVSTQRIEGSIPSLIAGNVEEVKKIVDLFMSHDQGFIRLITELVNKDAGGAP